jgi:uncharacterized protein YkwD
VVAASASLWCPAARRWHDAAFASARERLDEGKFAMPKHALLAAAALAVGFAVPAAAPPRMTASALAAPAHNPVERAVVRRVNAVRRFAGLPGLRLDRRLARAADEGSAAILRADVFSHAPDGRPMATRVRHRLPARLVGETIAWAAPGARARAEAVVDQWLSSPRHRAALLDGRFRRAGVARRQGHLGASPAKVTTLTLASAR